MFLWNKERTFWHSLGSVLGPLVFIVFINDVINLCDDVNETDITLFADDMTIHCSSAIIENLYLRINLILDLFEKWFTANKLTGNTNKNKYIIFHRTVTDSLFSLYLNNVPLETVASTDF